MQNLIIDNISLILLIPLWIFLMIMFGRFFSVLVNKKIIQILTLLSSMLGFAVCTLSLFKYENVLEWTLPFIKINDFIIDFGIRVDKLSLIMAVILFLVSFAVQLFSVSYMRDEKKSYRFFALLNLFNFGMASMLFSPNLFQIYVFWELIGIVSYLLIGFDYQSVIKSNSSKRVFIINRIGDTAFIAGIILTSYFMYMYSGNHSFVTLSIDDINSISVILSAYTSTFIFNSVLALFIIGCIVKSAQFPFHTWLQDAMEAPLPVSALLHSATMVAAGVYLIIRLMPFFTLNSDIMSALVVLGLFTAIICSIYAAVEVQPKKILAYSTSANLGLMIAALGLESVKAAVMLFCAHAVIKSMLFLLLPKEKDSMPKIGSIMFFVGALSLSGLLFAGIGAKEILYEQALSHSLILSSICIAIFISAYSMLRLGAILGVNNSAKSENLEMISPMLLLLANIVLYIYFRITENYNISAPYAVSVFAVLAIWIVWKRNLVFKFKNLPKFVEKLFNDYVPRAYSYAAESLNNAEMNVFTNYKPILKFSASSVCLFEWIEINVMNKTVSFIVNLSKVLSEKFKKLQSGNVQVYNFYALIIVTIMVSLIIVAYQVIINQVS